MKTEELDKIKKSLEEQGFEYIITDTNKDQVVMIIQSKDPWEGVEFFECGGEIIKLDSYHRQSNSLIVLNAKLFHETNCKPSTEQAYIEQLKKEAFERFGEIKQGDRFEEPNANKYNPSLLGGNLIFKSPNQPVRYEIRSDGWFYRKNIDQLKFADLCLYQQGKWATKIERIEVTKSINFHNYYTDVHHFAFHISKQIENASDIHSFLTEQLTKYLNEKSNR